MAAKVVLSSLSFEIRPGEFVALLGVSGAGKTTLLKTLIGEVSTFSGDITATGRFGYAPQRAPLFPWLTVFENLRLALPNSVASDDGENRIRDLLKRAQLESAGDLKPQALSGGMRTRVSLLRAFLMSAPVILMDEPFLGLDFVTRETLHELTLSLARETGATILFVTHDIDEALKLANRVLVLRNDGRGFSLDQTGADWKAIYEALNEG